MSKNRISIANVATQRLVDLLARLESQGITQAQVAARAGLPSQYLSDVRNQRRPLTELCARRLGDEFNALPGPELAVTLLERLARDKAPIIAAR